MDEDGEEMEEMVINGEERKSKFWEEKENNGFLERLRESVVLAEVKAIFKLSFGMILSNAFLFLMGITDLIFLVRQFSSIFLTSETKLTRNCKGHIGEAELAGAGLANSFSYITGYLAFSLQTGMDTLVPQAMGAGNHEMVGRVLQTCMLVVLCACIPVGGLWAVGKQIMGTLIPSGRMLDLSSTFLFHLLPGLLPLALFSVLKSFFDNQQNVRPGILVSFFCFILNIFFNWFFIHNLQMGFVGSPVATSVSRFCLAGLMLAYIYLERPLAQFWTWSWDFMRPKYLAKYLRLAVPSGVMLVLEVTGFEVITLMAGKLGDLMISANTIGFSVLYISFLFPFGFSNGTSARVGSFLGENNSDFAKKVAAIGFTLTAVWMTLNITVILIFRVYIVKAFSNDTAVIEASAKLMFFLCGVTVRISHIFIL